jgi:hypothetical protein
MPGIERPIATRLISGRGINADWQANVSVAGSDRIAREPATVANARCATNGAIANRFEIVLDKGLPRVGMLQQRN